MSMALKYAMKKRAQKMAEGGMLEEEMQSGYEPRPEAQVMDNEEAEMEDEDMISRIMRQRYSKGGMVANDTPMVADGEENDFDDLAMRDDLEADYTGDNSGDKLGNAHMKEQNEDMISRIMRSRGKKDRMPRPA